MAKKRLKREELIEILFLFFSEEFENNDVATIFDLVIPIDEILTYFKSKFEISYSGRTWIFTQIKKFEEENGTSIFKKMKNNKNQFCLALNKELKGFSQKKHLYVSQKIKVSNGIIDLISNLDFEDKQPLSIFLGGGSTTSFIAKLLFHNDIIKFNSLNIYSNNLEISKISFRYLNNSDSINVYLPCGRIDSKLNIILGNFTKSQLKQKINYIVIGTSFIINNKLFVENKEESIIKNKNLLNIEGIKILILTGHEFKTNISFEIFPFGELNNLDYIVVPNTHTNKNKQFLLREEYLNSQNFIEPFIINWNYRIFKISKKI